MNPNANTPNSVYCGRITTLRYRPYSADNRQCDKNKMLLACGSNGNFQLGAGHDEDLNELTEIELPVAGKPAKFAFGGNHTLVLMENQQVVSCGNNEWGQCGAEPGAPRKKFELIPGQWKDVAAGWDFSVFLGLDGSVHTCGYGPKGELGLGENVPRSQLVRVDIEPVQLVRLSINHVIVQGISGTFYGWGACRKGQMGPVPRTARGKPAAAFWQPEQLTVALPKPQFYALGHDRTAFFVNNHKERELYVIGKNPAMLPLGKDITKLRAMWSSLHYSYEEAGKTEIRSVGNNLHGQLFEYRCDGEIADFETGSEHGVLVTHQNKVYAWGWGEHGNCGRPSQPDQITFDFLNLLYVGTAKVSLIAAGCATTWVYTE